MYVHVQWDVREVLSRTGYICFSPLFWLGTIAVEAVYLPIAAGNPSHLPLVIPSVATLRFSADI